MVDFIQEIWYALLDEFCLKSNFLKDIGAYDPIFFNKDYIWIGSLKNLPDCVDGYSVFNGAAFLLAYS